MLVNTSVTELPNNEMSHLVRFIISRWTDDSVPFCYVSHLVSVPLSEVFITIKKIEENSDWLKMSHLLII